MPLDDGDLRGARATEVAVIGEHPTGFGRVALVQKHFDRFTLTDHVGGAQLRREGRALGCERAFTLGALPREHGAAPFALFALAPHPIELVARGARRTLRFTQAAGESVAFCRILRDLRTYPLDFGTQLLQLGLGARRILRHETARSGR